MPEETLFESEHETDRATVAAYLRSLADGIEDGADLAFDDVVVTVPASTSFEVDVEREGEEYELELEVACEPVDVGGAEAGESAPAGADAEQETASADAERTTTDADAEQSAPTDEPVPEAAHDTVDLGEPGAAGEESQATFEVYRDRADEWRWRLRHRNGNVIADSGEGYGRRGTAENGLRSVKRNAPGATVAYPDE